MDLAMESSWRLMDTSLKAFCVGPWKTKKKLKKNLIFVLISLGYKEKYSSSRLMGNLLPLLRGRVGSRCCPCMHLQEKNAWGKKERNEAEEFCALETG